MTVINYPGCYEHPVPWGWGHAATLRWNHDEDAEVQMTLLMTKLVRIIIIDVPFNFNLINQ